MSEETQRGLEKTIAELRETVKRLNRRCQLAESAAATKLDALTPRELTAGTFGRSLLTWACVRKDEEIAELRQAIKDKEVDRDAWQRSCEDALPG